MKQKKIALINDVTGFGRCSTAVMAPIVSAMKIQAVTVPTAILSAHPQFKEYFIEDYTPKLKEYINTYKVNKLDFDGIATGFLGSEAQVDIVADFIETFRREDTVVLVDPVMGDNGILYKSYTPSMCQKIRDLVKYANILTPNLTELCALLGADYGEGKFDLDQLEAMCKELAAMGPEHIVVTGIPFHQTQILNYIYSRGASPKIVTVDKIGNSRGGTGDVISGVIAGKYLNGESFYDSVKTAAAFTSKCLKYCEENAVPDSWGLPFEMYLSDLISE
jgi:pyridoxine kinase